MKNKRVILEYCEAKSSGRKKGKWGFRFKTASGLTLFKSEAKFTSLEQAEKGFLALIKSIATNQYTVNYPGRTEDAALSRN